LLGLLQGYTNRQVVCTEPVIQEGERLRQDR